MTTVWGRAGIARVRSLPVHSGETLVRGALDSVRCHHYSLTKVLERGVQIGHDRAAHYAETRRRAWRR